MSDDAKAEAYRAALTVAGAAASELTCALAAVDTARIYAVDSWSAATAAARALGIEPDRTIVCVECLQPVSGVMIRNAAGRFTHYPTCPTPPLLPFDDAA